jgi:hypothetical protein
MSFDAEVCRRLPLADAALHLLDYVADDAFLADLFDRHRGRCYERAIGFADLVHLLAEALTVHGQSAHRTFVRARADGDLAASARAAYDKVARLPPAVSAALLTDGTARLRAILPATAGEPVPASLDEFTPLAFDGKKVKAVARRLRPTRVVRGQVLGGKLLVAEDIRTGLAVAMEAHPDGEASDLALVPGLLARVRAVGGPPRLWVGDRLFCDLVHLPLLAADGDHFLVRYQSKVGFHPDPDRPAQAGVNGRGQAFTDEWGWLGDPADDRRQYVRRVTVHRPDAEDVAVVTDLTDPDRYPAAGLLDLYLRRWGIERLFQKTTEVFHLDALVSARENGTVFQAAVCLLLYNLTVVVRAHVAVGAGRPPAGVSLEKVFGDLCRQLTGLVEVLGAPAVVTHYAGRRWTAAALREYLAALLGPTWRHWWTKSPPRKPTKTVPTEYLKGGHSSVYRIARGLHETIANPDPPATAQPRPSKQ